MSSEQVVEEFNLEEKTLNKFKIKGNFSQDNKDDGFVKIKIKTIDKKIKKIKKEQTKDKEKKTIAKEKARTKKKVFIYPDGFPPKYIDFDKNSKKIWSKFHPKYFLNEMMYFKVAFMGVPIGFLTLTTKPRVEVGGVDAFHFEVLLKSADFYSYVYRLNDRIDSFVRSDNFLPLKFNLTQRESSQRVDDLQFFDHEKLKTMSFYKKNKKGKVTKKQKESFTPRYFNDLFSAIYFLRGLPFKTGDRYEFPVVTRGRVWKMKLNTLSTDAIISFKGIKYKAIKIQADNYVPGKIKKTGTVIFWYSNDERRILLKFEAKVKIGSVNGELANYTYEK